MRGDLVCFLLCEFSQNLLGQLVLPVGQEVSSCWTTRWRGIAQLLPVCGSWSGRLFRSLNGNVRANTGE